MLDFEVEIGTGTGQSYPLALLHSPAGEARETMKFPFDELALDSALKSLEIALLSASGIRRQAFSPEEQSVQDFGKQLFSALLTGELRSRYDMSRDEARQKGQGLRLKLRILAPELAKLPWEFLYDPRRGEYLALSRDTPMVRYIEIPQSIQPLSVQPPLQILGMVASPSDLPVLDVDREKQRVEKALERLQSKNLVKLTWLEGETWRDLQRAMRAGPWHIFHFIGHGGFDKTQDEGLVALSDDSGCAHYLSASDLGMLLSDHRSLRMVVLNACEGARASSHDIFSSTASILVRRGMPAVLAMQYPITDRAAVEFSQAFYEALSDGLPVDSAVSEARKAISLAMASSLEWGTPVLYLRSPQGVIFDLQAQSTILKAPPPVPPPVSNPQVDRLYTDGLAAFWVEDWDRACSLLQQVVALQPSNTAAAAKLEEARKQRRLAGLYARALKSRDAGNLDDAVSALETLAADNASYKDAASLLQQLRKQKLLVELYNEAQRLHAASEWEAVVKIFDQIATIDPNYPDSAGLLPSAKQALAEKQRQEELEQLYNRGVHAIEAGQWTEAQLALRQVSAADPNYQETPRLLQRIQEHIPAAPASPQLQAGPLPEGIKEAPKASAQSPLVQASPAAQGSSAQPSAVPPKPIQVPQAPPPATSGQTGRKIPMAYFAIGGAALVVVLCLLAVIVYAISKQAAMTGSYIAAPTDTFLPSTFTPEPSQIVSNVTDTPVVSVDPLVTPETPTSTFTPAATEAIPVMATPPAGQTTTREIDGMTMVYIPGGNVILGASKKDAEILKNDPNELKSESPEVTVYVDGFWMDQTEVTNAMFRKFVEAMGYKTIVEAKDRNKYDGAVDAQVFDSKGDIITTRNPNANWQNPDGSGHSIANLGNYPVGQIAWDDADAYCKWAGGSLPTEAQWTRAGRGDDDRVYPWGDTFDQTAYNGQYSEKTFPFTKPVGSIEKGKSPYGVYDLAGNVAEWVWDYYDETYFSRLSPSTNNPQGPTSESSHPLLHFLKGGSWMSGPVHVRIADRTQMDKEMKHEIASQNFGFRCVQQ
jgi:formylglycine-generating enzyme required for sulfatase activity